MEGRTLSHFRVLAKLGEGGMGVVYKAEDEKLRRLVALKVLPPAFVAEEVRRRRFVREAQLAASLSHPAIAAIYEVGEEADTAFIAMEYVEGRTLRSVIGGHALSVDQALAIATQIAGGLERAHRAGVVHRDLKPDNVIVQPDGRIKILDFGLAKLREGAPLADSAASLLETREVELTREGVVVGTPGYMSPEQARGGAVDARSDLFSLGVVLYEMLTGANPFRADTPVETLSAILREQPAPLHERNPLVPVALARVADRLLAKDPSARPVSAAALLEELARVNPATSPQEEAPPEPTQSMPAPFPRRSTWIVAALALVLAGATLIVGMRPPPPHRALAFKERDFILITDFENLTGDKVFDRSLRVALEVAIAQSQHVNVLPSSRLQETLRRMQRPAVDHVDEALASEVALREGIRAVLACSVAQVGDVYSLTARLVDPRSRMAVLTDSIQAGGKNQVLSALDTLATRVRRDLGESLAAISQRGVPLPQVTTSSLEALKMYSDSLTSHEPDQEAAELLRQALAIDPDFALAHAELGRRYYLRSSRANRMEGEEHFVKALSLLDRLSTRERLLVRAIAADSRGNRQEAVESYRGYLVQYPDDGKAWFRLGWTQMAALNQPQAALSAFQRVIAIDPSDAGAQVNLATCHAGLGKSREALAEYRKAFALRPAFLTAHFVNHEYGFTLARVGELDAAAEVFGKMLATDDREKQARGRRSLGLLDMYRGRYSAASASFREAVAINRSTQNDVSEFRDRLFLARALEARGMTADYGSELDGAHRMALRMSLDPNWLRPLAKLQARSGRLPQARRILALMSRTAGVAAVDSSVARDMSHDQAQIDLARGEIARAEGRSAEAARLFEAAVLVEPHNDDMLESLAAAATAAGRLPEAARRYEELIALRPLGLEGQEHWLRAQVRVGEVYERLGRPAAAKETYERLLATWKDGDADLVARKEAMAGVARLGAAAQP